MIDLREVRRIADLAHIEFDQAGLEQMARELSKILDYIDQLKEIPVESAASAASAAPTSMRDDAVTPTVTIDGVAENAPSFSHGFFVVPRVIGGEP